MLGKRIPLYRLLFPFNAVWVLYVLLFGQRIVANTVYQNTPLVFRHFSTNSPQSTKHYLAGTNSNALPTHCKSTNLWLNICLTPTKTFCTASPLPWLHLSKSDACINQLLTIRFDMLSCPFWMKLLTDLFLNHTFSLRLLSRFSFSALPQPFLLHSLPILLQCSITLAPHLFCLPSISSSPSTRFTLSCPSFFPTACGAHFREESSSPLEFQYFVCRIINQET